MPTLIQVVYLRENCWEGTGKTELSLLVHAVDLQKWVNANLHTHATHMPHT